MKIKRQNLLILLLVGLLLLSLLSACSSKQFPDQGSNDNRDPSDGYFDSDNDGTDPSSDSKDLLPVDRKMIFTSTMNIETTEYDKSILALEALVREYKGYIQESRVESHAVTGYGDTLRKANYKIRVPAADLDQFLKASGNVGSIVLSGTKGEDVTERFFDTQARIQSLTVQEERLISLLEESETLKDMLDIEDRLSDVRYEIETLTGTLNKLSALIALSTVNVEIREVRVLSQPDPDTFLEQVQRTFFASIQALTQTLRYLFLAIVAIFPFLVAFGIFVLIIYLVVRFCTRKKRRNRKSSDAVGKEPNNPDRV